jgi:hypothetical protein
MPTRSTLPLGDSSAEASSLSLRLLMHPNRRVGASRTAGHAERTVESVRSAASLALATLARRLLFYPNPRISDEWISGRALPLR